jgi:hypothetical protein
MTKINLPNSEKDTKEVDKQVVILAGGMGNEEKFQAEVDNLMEEKLQQSFNIKNRTHIDLMNLRIHWFDNRDLPSTCIDDAFRRICSYGNLKNVPNHFPITLEQINDLTYQMLQVTQEEISGGLTAEDVANIWEGSIQNFHEILRSVGTTQETYEEKVIEARDFWRQFARTLKEKRKNTHKSE